MPSKKKSRRTKRNYDVDKRKIRRKMRRKPVIKCKQINDFWDKKKSVQQNLRDMGLAYDANKVLKLPGSRKLSELQQVEEVKLKPKVPEVLEGMEMEVALGEKEKRFLVPSEDVHFCTYMMETYKENYKLMARDRRNHYQLTPKQIRDKIRSFKRSKTQYKEYLEKKRGTNNVTEPDLEEMES